MKSLVRPVTACALIAVLSLAGCGGDEEPAEQSGSSTGAETTPAAGDAGEGGKGDQAGEGDKKVKSKKVPKDFPREVPRVDGVVSVAAKQGGTWLVQVEVDASQEEVADRAIDKVLGAGFTETSRTEGDSSVMVTATGAGYDVTLTIADNGGASTVLYAVTAA